MLRYKLPDGRRSAPRSLAALLLSLTAFAPAAHADLSHTTAPPVDPAAAAHEADTLQVEPLRAGAGALLAGRFPALTAPDWRSLLAPVGHDAGHDERSAMQLWLSQAWPLGLAVRPAPAAMLTLWLTGSMHQVLAWIAQPAFEPELERELDAELGLEVATDEAIERALGLITVEPVTGGETSSYGYRRDPFTNRRKFHKGVDYRAPRGTPVFAAGPGVVRWARRKSGYGRVIMLDHGAGVETRYAHLQSIEVDAGEHVAAGARIGTVGSTGRATGPHLHFELRIDGDAHDPQEMLAPLVPAELVSQGF
jgi:murein DD-endopeptidase MepM/ murein hydrolase activator NlpD